MGWQSSTGARLVANKCYQWVGYTIDVGIFKAYFKLTCDNLSTHNFFYDITYDISLNHTRKYYYKKVGDNFDGKALTSDIIYAWNKKIILTDCWSEFEGRTYFIKRIAIQSSNTSL